MVAFIVAAGVFVVSRPRHRSVEAALAPLPEEPVPAPAPVPAVVERPSPPIAIRPAVPIAAPPPPPESPVETAPDDVATALRRRASLIAAHKKQLLDEADERAFEVARVSESARIAIRGLNEEFGRRIQAIPSPSAGGQRMAGGNTPAFDSYDAVRNARRDAISALLDAETARAFEVAERDVEANLRAHYRRSWNQELRAKAPLPASQPLEGH
jgi:hypothetical protein